MTKYIGLDIGTDKIRICTEDGLVVNQPSFVTVDRYTDKIECMGADAKLMTRKTEDRYETYRLIERGIISLPKYANTFLEYFFKKNKISKKSDVICSIPGRIEKSSEQTILSVLYGLGLKNIYLIDAVMASALGAGVDIEKLKGRLVLNLEGGLTQGGLITYHGFAPIGKDRKAKFCIDKGGKDLRYSIQKYFKTSKRLINKFEFGELTLQEILERSYLMEQEDIKKRFKVSGLALIRNKDGSLYKEPKSRRISTTTICRLLTSSKYSDYFDELYDKTTSMLKKINPEFFTDLADKENNPVIITGGLLHLRGLKDFLIKKFSNSIGIEVPDDPENCVIKGIEKIIKEGRVKEYADIEKRILHYITK